MGKKTIIICDLCKNETEQDLIKLSLKRPEKDYTNKYEICLNCYNKLVLQFSNTDKLQPIWKFESIGTERKTKNEVDLREIDRYETNFEEMSNDRLSKSGVRNDSIEVHIPEIPENKIKIETSELNENKSCSHLNKSENFFGTVNNTTKMYRRCKDCNQVLAVPTKKERMAYMSSKLPEGIRIGEKT